ncbi:hypothetical protein A3K34_03905 [candidate division WWE3 bacterium RIFOXYC1_FULL_40_10]|uniref:Cell division protein FtsX n=1 Tax=candidate division WWE3 bacterium RIFOXYA2_FULL_46_9 TaxID=1802636 RepID=A0A1F4W1H9_UNCKA|nr:MAG: hypothetical protein A3K58_03905 [candidate division WWE3 bacterium RIFOXYB1_FULL_40_22]OGC61985.1 MAG: hypothetical protein A3K37_03905 [candidate division WWE3 bacterium RIFOXYA1_FULL_40_11]OGC62903.1 MAG: hypothetical protein A2264_03425 [candidate division WWE3 bacterium RIFOXYA2_FULL_46_9]OGC65071.1 MAG: hypothetical protein A2326_03470 [candidate division WWE3 bacterium RIFOXYB2_FULL_41_6]OGC66368.1 MAG: hypothetical protein A3K34_03905 [candidate division WWE3 bacterium RIFOXYC1_
MVKSFTRMMQDVKKESLLSVSNLFVMIITFMVLGLFIRVVAFSQTFVRTLEDQVRIAVFFKDDYSEELILASKARLESNPKIKSVEYVSKQQAYEIFKELNKNDEVILEALSPEILPASLNVNIYKLSEIEPVAEELRLLDGVEPGGVKYFKDAIANFRLFSTIAYIGGFVLAGMFLLISYSIIIVTLRTAINSKGMEFEIMKLVGATDDYVMSPLVRMGVYFGLFSAFVSSALLSILDLVLAKVGFIPGSISFGFLYYVNLPLIVFSILVFIAVVLSGVFLGYLGSYTAIKKYLKY